MNKFNTIFKSIVEKRDGETDEEAQKRLSSNIDKLKQMSQIKKDMQAGGNTQDARLQALKNLTDLRFNKNQPTQQSQTQPLAQPSPVTAQTPKFDPKKFDDIDNEVGNIQQPVASTVPTQTQPAAQEPIKPRSKEEIKSQFNKAYADYVMNRQNAAAQPTQTEPQISSSTAATATLPPAAAIPQPAAAKPVDSAKITKQYDTMSKIASDPNAPAGEKAAAQKKMSDFETKYQEIINKHKSVPSAAAPVTPAPAAAPVTPAPVTPAPAAAPVTPAPAAAPVTPSAPTAPSVATPTVTPAAAPVVAPPGGGKIPPPSAGGGGGRKGGGGGGGRGGPPRAPRNVPQQPGTNNLSGLQQQFKGMGLSPGKQGQQQQRGPGLISRIAAAPVNALNKGIGAYSKIVNAPRRLGQALKAAAGGEPYPLQQQIAGTAQKAGLTAVKQPEPGSQSAAQQYTNQQKINDLIQRIRKNPNDQQAIIQLKGMGY